MASTSRILDLLDTTPQITGGEKSLVRPRGELSFEGVSFRYANGASIFTNLSLEFPAGETTAIVGATGSGKTSVVKLLLRFYDVQAGSVTLDGVDVRELGLRELRGHIGIVPQEPMLFAGTVWENLAYGRPDATDQEIEEAARQAHAHDFISTFPKPMTSPSLMADLFTLVPFTMVPLSLPRSMI